MFELLNVTIIIASSSYLVLQGVFFCTSLNCSLLHNNQGVAVWGGKCLNVRNDVVANIVCQSCLDSPACVDKCRILLLDIGSFSGHAIEPRRQHCLLQALDVGLRVQSQMGWDDECVAITCGYSNHHDVD